MVRGIDSLFSPSSSKEEEDEDVFKSLHSEEKFEVPEVKTIKQVDANNTNTQTDDSVDIVNSSLPTGISKTQAKFT